MSVLVWHCHELFHRILASVLLFAHAFQLRKAEHRVVQTLIDGLNAVRVVPVVAALVFGAVRVVERVEAEPVRTVEQEERVARLGDELAQQQATPVAPFRVHCVGRGHEYVAPLFEMLDKAAVRSILLVHKQLSEYDFALLVVAQLFAPSSHSIAQLGSQFHRTLVSR